jgi:hypothetical protein
MRFNFVKIFRKRDPVKEFRKNRPSLVVGRYKPNPFPKLK